MHYFKFCYGGAEKSCVLQKWLKLSDRFTFYDYTCFQFVTVGKSNHLLGVWNGKPKNGITNEIVIHALTISPNHHAPTHRGLSGVMSSLMSNKVR